MPSASVAAASASPSLDSDALTLLLPERVRIRGELAATTNLAKLVARGDRDASTPGSDAQLLRCFDVLPRGLAVAALTREADCRDAAQRQWLRADPAYLRADMATARMLACGELDLTREEADALVAPLKPLFGDEGFPISVGAASRWYLSLPLEARPPAFAPPQDVLGDDIYPHLPSGDAGRRWRRLLSEAQVVLHNHPINAERVRQGKPPVNSLWFWGGGALPDHVRANMRRVYAHESVLVALASRAGIAVQPAPAAFAQVEPAGALIDLREVRDLEQLEQRCILPALARMRSADFSALRLDFADGLRIVYRASMRWRFWRRAATSLA